MDDALAICADYPTRTLDTGQLLVAEGDASDALYVLSTGAVEVRKQDMTVTRVDEPGAFLGEISALLGTPYSANVVALEPTTVHVIVDPAAAIDSRPALALAVARLLARRLQAVTSYLADLKRQYGGAEGHLAMMDQVLSELTSMRPRSLAPGSERDDVPDY